MKNLKKLASVALALVMTMALMVPAFAAEETGSITVDNPQQGQTYTAYKLFDLSADSQENPTRYSYTYTKDTNVELDALVNEYFETQSTSGSTTVITVTGFKSGKTAGGFAAALHDAIADGTLALTGGTELTGEKPTATLPLGYYFVSSNTGSVCNLDTNAPDVTIYDKNETQKITKTAEEAAEEVNDAIVRLGETVTYTITGKVPSTDGFAAGSYIYKINDTMTGAKFGQLTEVKIGDTDVTSAAAAWITVAADSLSFEMNIPVENYQDQIGDTITVKYTGIVTADGIQVDKATNSATLTTKNDPTDEGNGTPTTPEVVTLNVANVEIFKYIGNSVTDGADPSTGTPLAGASFVLQNSAGNYYTFVEATETEDAKIEWVSNRDDATKVTPDDGKIVFNGLGSGTYTLIETEAPEGYNLMTESGDNTIVINTTNATEGNEYTVKRNVPNFTGAELPSTGGMGTTIFYVVGGVLLVGSAILFVTKKRMGE